MSKRHVESKFLYRGKSNSSKRAAIEGWKESKTPLTNQVSYYTADIYVGHNAFTVDIDTGSADLWLMGPRAATGSQRSYHSEAKSVNSAAGNQTQNSFQINYGDGSNTSGRIVQDRVEIANVSVARQAIGIADEVTSSLNWPSFAADGVLGLAWPALSSVGDDGGVLVGLGVDVFSVGLMREGEEFIWFQPEIRADIIWTKVVDRKYWMIEADGISVSDDGSDSKISTVERTRMIVDTGSTLLLGPADVISNLLLAHKEIAAIPNAEGSYSFICAKPPRIAIVIAGVEVVIAGDHLNGGVLPVEYGGSATIAAGEKQQQQRCILTVGGVKGLTWFIAGDTFLKGLQVFFDLRNGRVGISTVAG